MTSFTALASQARLRIGHTKEPSSLPRDNAGSKHIQRAVDDSRDGIILDQSQIPQRSIRSLSGRDGHARLPPNGNAPIEGPGLVTDSGDSVPRFLFEIRQKPQWKLPGAPAAFPATRLRTACASVSNQDALAACRAHHFRQILGSRREYMHGRDVCVD